MIQDVSKMSDSELSEVIAEFLGNGYTERPCPFNGACRYPGCAKVNGIYVHACSDFVTDPKMTDMLWKKLAAQYDFETALMYVQNTEAAKDDGSVDSWNRAVAEAFAQANGLGEK